MSVTALQYRNAFIQAYADLRIATPPADWLHAWTSDKRWSVLMRHHPDSVLYRAARALNLALYPGEPQRLDCVYFLDEPHHMPADVVLEIENNVRGFHDEIRSLLAARARLKVGITYLTRVHRPFDSYRVALRKDFLRTRAQAARRVGEDPQTEYLFLLGVEGGASADLAWESLICTAQATDVPQFQTVIHLAPAQSSI